MFKKSKDILKGKNSILKIIILFLLFLLCSILLAFTYYSWIILTLPDVKNLKTLDMPQSSIIYDKKGGELYKIYSEKRTYVNLEKINENMINAIIAGEDKRYWTHPGYDKIGIIRALYNGITTGNNISGTSGITQQLVKITYLTNARTIERKLKELHLSYNISKEFSKKDILELYLNKVFFGGNSYGVEQASNTYFGKSAKNISVLESTILASLPKAPSGLSPYIHKDRLLGYPVLLDEYDPNLDIKILSSENFINNKAEINLLINFINNLTSTNNGKKIEICGINKEQFSTSKIKLNSDNCVNIKYSNLLSFLGSISINYDSKLIKYNTGRKDYILGRMLEDKYINFEEYKEAINGSFGFEFKKYIDEIKYPHFVMYILDNLSEKYSEKLLRNGGLKIYTTINPYFQDKAQELIDKKVIENTKKYGARNAALISIDNQTGEIVSMIGGVNYFDELNFGYNNMILSRLQPGSTFKPFVYILAMIKEGFTKDTIFTDDEFTFPGDYKPKNADGEYMGKITLSKALNYSRNIPAVKIYYAAGEEFEIIKFLKGFGIQSLEKFKEEYKEKFGFNYSYSAPMALGTVQITPFELAEAYSVFANNGVKKDLFSILKITDSEGNILEETNLDNLGTRILDENIAIKMNNILSNTEDRPKIWNYFLTLNNRILAAKTGTSSKQFKENPEDEEDTVFPKDMWTVGYTPQYTTVVWAGNTSGEELHGDAFGMNGTGLIMKYFMEFIHKNLEAKNWY